MFVDSMSINQLFVVNIGVGITVLEDMSVNER